MKKITVFILVFVCISFVNSSLFAQIRDERYTSCGKFKLWLIQHNLDEGGLNIANGDAVTYDFLYPADFETQGSRSGADFDNRRTLMTFAAEDWTDAAGNYYPKALENEMFFQSLKKVVKYPNPQLTLDGQDFSRLQDYEQVDPNLVADQMIETVFHTAMGISCNMRAYVYSHVDYEHFAIIHYQFVNTGEADEIAGVDLPNQTINNLYVSWSQMPYLNYSVDEIHKPGRASIWLDYYGDEPSDTLNMVYVWDTNDPTNDPWEDEGNPSIYTGEFLTPQYYGIGVIHADKNPADRSNDLAQPNSVFRSTYNDFNNYSVDEYYDYVTSGEYPSPIDPDSGEDPWFVQNNGMIVFTVGPWDLQFGDTINIVLAGACGARTTEECKEMGQKWLKGEITDAQKNEFLRYGKVKLAHNIHKAKIVWENGLSLPGGMNPVPPTSMSLDAGPGEVYADWSQVSGNNGPYTYNLYRGLGVQDSILYDLIAGGLEENSYTDTDVKRGFNYYYDLTAVDKNGLESSRYWLRSSHSIVPFASQGKQVSDVRVVPNPFVYDHSGERNYTGQKDKVMFAGLPGPCIIRIYTQSGDMVEELDHPGQEGTHEWFSVTRNNQYVMSGIYVYYVESTEGKGSTFGKFVIIR